MKTVCLALYFSCLLALQAAALSENNDGPKGDSHLEKYQYEAVPLGKEEDRERIESVVSLKDDSIELTSRSVSRKAEERIRVTMTGRGNLISGARDLTDSSGNFKKQKIWRDESTVRIEENVGGDKKTKVLDIPQGTILAVESSFTVLLRFFPYGSGTRWNLFMIDFAGQSAVATASETGTESIDVPAGEYLCHRLEILFHVPILNPKVVCWVSVEEPHIIVKAIGKRGFFTPQYATSLTGEDLSPPAAAMTAQ